MLGNNHVGGEEKVDLLVVGEWKNVGTAKVVGVGTTGGNN